MSFLQISFWLLENGFSVLIAACDTFRAGAVEQLRTHTRRLSALHPPESHGGRTMVHLFEKGYGKDAAGIAMEAIAFGTVCAMCGNLVWAPFFLGFASSMLSVSQGYPTTNRLLGSKSGLVTCRALLWVIGVVASTATISPQKKPLYLVTWINCCPFPDCAWRTKHKIGFSSPATL